MVYGDELGFGNILGGDCSGGKTIATKLATHGRELVYEKKINYLCQGVLSAKAMKRIYQEFSELLRQIKVNMALNYSVFKSATTLKYN